jgi:hypothetical protein
MAVNLETSGKLVRHGSHCANPTASRTCSRTAEHVRRKYFQLRERRCFSTSSPMVGTDKASMRPAEGCSSCSSIAVPTSALEVAMFVCVQDLKYRRDCPGHGNN